MWKAKRVRVWLQDAQGFSHRAHVWDLVLFTYICIFIWFLVFVHMSQRRWLSLTVRFRSSLNLFTRLCCSHEQLTWHNWLSTTEFSTWSLEVLSQMLHELNSDNNTPMYKVNMECQSFTVLMCMIHWDTWFQINMVVFILILKNPHSLGNIFPFWLTSLSLP